MSDATPLPFAHQVSLRPLLRYWEEEAPAPLREAVRSAVAAVPGLDADDLDLETVARYEDAFVLLFSGVFAPALGDAVLGAACAPCGPRTLYETTGFRRLLRPHLDDLPEAVEGGLATDAAMARNTTAAAYHHVLSGAYGVAAPWKVPFVIPAHADGVQRYFELTSDARFVTVEPTGALPPMTDVLRRELLDAPFDFERWRAALPETAFVLRGFLVLHAADVTLAHVLSLLKTDLLKKDAMATPERLDVLQERLRSLLGQPELRLGLVALERDEADAIRGARAVGRSLLVSGGRIPACEDADASLYGEAIRTRAPVVVRSLAHCHACTAFEAHLREQGVGSVALAPLDDGGRLVGLLELAGPAEGMLGAAAVHRLEPVLPLFATALRRSQEEREDRLQALIKRHYTAIHPVVEWRFRQAGLRALEAEAAGRPVDVEPIVFRDVVPLYGLSDIRDSSTHRSDALRADLVAQLGLARAAVRAATAARALPALAELDHRIGRYLDEIASALRLDHEAAILPFLRARVEPLFDHLAGFGPEAAARIADYRDALDPELGFLYHARRRFEASVTRINAAIAEVIETSEREAQALVPHYFELYKTDGVDYNVYAGASLLEQGAFTALQLQSLRLWQLTATCAVARTLARLRPTLPLPLDVAHLVLVESTPLAIRFREEEKQFDVDGAYNIRYEITKKRIDKAVVAETHERVTQPGHLAVIYSTPAEAAEYEQYLDYLHAQGLVDAPVERFTLEEQPGANGLKALRVRIAVPEADDARGDGQPDLARDGDAEAAPAVATVPRP